MNSAEIERELNVAIAKLVFGMRLEVIESNPKYTGCFVDTWIRGMGKPVKYPQGICIGSFDSNKERAVDLYVPDFTDPAAAFEVLKKCAENLGTGRIHIYAPTGQFNFWLLSNAEAHRKVAIEASAETLELATCRFAQHLFTKPK